MPNVIVLRRVGSDHCITARFRRTAGDGTTLRIGATIFRSFRQRDDDDLPESIFGSHGHEFPGYAERKPSTRATENVFIANRRQRFLEKQPIPFIL